MSKSYRPWAPLQPYLLPPSPTEWLPQDHLAYFILEVVGQLDLASIEQAIAAKDPRGERPYAPPMMVALLLYGYCVGVFSSRRIARATHEDVAFRVLAAGAHPHFTTINDFRLHHGPALGDLFVQGLHLCQRAGLVKLGHVSVDGSKILANASKHKAMSHKRMQEEEARLRAEVEALLRRADEVNRQEDELYGADCDPWFDLPEELRHRETRLAKIREIGAELKKEAAATRAAQLREQARSLQTNAANSTLPTKRRKEAKAKAATRIQQALALEPPRTDDDDDDPPSGPADDLPKHRLQTKPNGDPTPKTQRNFTDADSRIMIKNGAWVQAYNAQIAVDAAHQIIVAQAVTNQPPDVEHFVPVLERVEKNAGRNPERVSADSGYFSEANVAFCEEQGIEPYISVGRATHGGSQTFNATAHPSPTRDRMLAKLRSAQGRAVYARRKVIAEPPLGQIQAARGFRRFSVRGLAKVRWEWAFVSLTHNLLKLFRHEQALALPA